MKLVAKLPKDRNQPGVMEVHGAGPAIVLMPVLGLADAAMAKQKGNPSRSPERCYGDTPTGVWKVHVSIIMRDERAFGPHKVLLLSPISGQAYNSYLSPARRSGILIHGGAPGAGGNLRPTYGCLRVSNDSMARLHELIAQYGPIETLETIEV